MMSMESLTRKRVEQARHALLHVHQVLLETERIRYERQHGRVPGSGAFLQIVLNDPWFYWLRPIPTLIALLDEWLEADPPPDDATTRAELLLAQVRDRLRPDEDGADFQQRYFQLLQEEPALAVAHAEVRKSINA